MRASQYSPDYDDAHQLNQSPEEMFISLVPQNNLLERINLAEEPLRCVAPLIYPRANCISPSRFVFPVSPVDQGIAPGPPYPGVITNLSDPIRLHLPR